MQTILKKLETNDCVFIIYLIYYVYETTLDGQNCR